MSRIDPTTLKVGDVFYECAYGNCVKFTVTSDAIVENDQIKWKASSENITETDFLITKGYEHYGPKIYSSPAYISA